MDTIPKNYLALGDSYTIGESVTVSERFPVQTVEMLRNKDMLINNADIIATTGWTTHDLINALNVPPPLPVYDIVTLLIGVNNQYQGKKIDDYQKEFSELLLHAIQLAGGNARHVIVLSIPDYSVTPFASSSDKNKIAKEIDEFNAVNKIITLKNDVNYIDITAISREVPNEHSLVANDGLHPSPTQYTRWSDLLSKMIITIFTNETGD
ncbi:MAG: SGNH/GDSL hydrolase family protein [Ginsengibacter sp.]